MATSLVRLDTTRYLCVGCDESDCVRGRNRYELTILLVRCEQPTHQSNSETFYMALEIYRRLDSPIHFGKSFVYHVTPAIFHLKWTLYLCSAQKRFGVSRFQMVLPKEGQSMEEK